MKNHVWRPLYIALCLAALILLVRQLVVPSDFGIQEQGYMYGWHRKSNEQQWKSVQVKYATDARCKECHQKQYRYLKDSPHSIISCENCHGPNYDHPRDPIGYTVDRSRALCIRCHSRLPYPGDIRGRIPGINPETHYSPAECVLCHLAHNPRPMRQKQEVKP